jgi:hypothetical protein
MLLRLKLRTGAMLLIVGALLAVVGEVVNVLNNAPLSTAWFLSIGLLALGTLIMIYGVSMYAQLSEDINFLGVISTGILFLGGILVIVGTIAIDAVVLPLLYGLATAIATTINTLGVGVQNAANTTSSGLTSVANSIANAFVPGSGNASIPQAQIPQVNGLDIVNSALSSMKLPTVNVIGNWGHFFFTGGPLAVGVLLLGLSFLRIKTFPRLTTLLLIGTAGLNLLCQLFLLLAILQVAASLLFFLTSVTSVLLFLALVWLGVSVLFPDKVNFSFDLSFLRSMRIRQS